MSKVIPANWLPVRFEEIFTQISTSGKKVKTTKLLAKGKFPVVDQGRAFISGYLDDSNLVVSDEKPLIIFGDHTREIKWIDFPFIPGADGVKILKPHSEVNGRFLYFFLRNLQIEGKGYARHFKILKDAEYFLPPLPEQTRTAQKLDQLLVQVDIIKARIDAIPTLIKRFRQSVLAAATSGRLTEHYRQTNNHYENVVPNLKSKNLSAEELAGAEELLGEPLPSCWTKYALEQLVEPERGIPYGIVQTGNAASKGVPTVRCGDVKYLFIETSALKLVSPEIEQNYQRTRLKGGEVLLAIRGSVGNVGVVPETLRDCNISREVAMIPTLPSVFPFFLACLLQSPVGQRLLAGKIRGVAQKGINLADVKRLPVALPPCEEQTEIVRLVEQLFAFADQLEAKVTSAKKRIDHLTQSILTKAFRGELVPQDPNDEPASVLLERIKAQRASAPKATRGRKASA
ncbi:type I restriction enzyme, S subunit [Pseudomonas sp. NFACC32-1]|uniref:restriction endonuclease subunit S n=1 Tax=Pseudomonas sp. NFACC32-1 TaxID=1566198 RepID=UPI0008765280|nr:restriction endonuclease subunit S [Pseudomonas sp. NFACC32-1]SCX68502.1 type I restriction enzyme, S subunit [Pseudomonas sp. NFACC32-1]